jgi:hypothetical protein
VPNVATDSHSADLRVYLRFPDFPAAGARVPLAEICGVLGQQADVGVDLPKVQLFAPLSAN